MNYFTLGHMREHWRAYSFVVVLYAWILYLDVKAFESAIQSYEWMTARPANVALLRAPALSPWTGR